MKKLLVFLLPLVMLAACQPKGEKVPAIDLTDMAHRHGPHRVARR